MIKHLVIAILLSAILFAAAGCTQEIVYREFFAPSEGTKLVREDGTTVGAVRIEATKAGTPDWSDRKTLNFSFF